MLLAVTGLYGCAQPATPSASRSASLGASAASPSGPLAGLAPPQTELCQQIVSAADLSGVATEASAIVEGDSPDKVSVVLDSDASQFRVTKVLKAVPGLHPSGTIEIIFGPPNSGDYLPAGKYLLFLQYNPIGKVYTIPSSRLGNRVVTGEFLLTGISAAERQCGTAPTAGTAPNTALSAKAAASGAALSPSALEGFVGQLGVGQALTQP